ncbi:hypothetical protein GGR50DRAFT_656027 [Xylaria sp. CBS 124048]|nr:hypothetical protein GGR50DRAFT_656027 [Xylaria sp. CBS 124048]
MSSQNKVPIIFTFHRSGVQPPVFVAGSFSDPRWQPLEMDVAVDEHGEFTFTKQVMVNECSDIQYKFRHGFGDWWALDPGARTVMDEDGNVNSFLRSPPTRGVTPKTPTRNEATDIGLDTPKRLELAISSRDTDDNTGTPVSSQGAAQTAKPKRLFFTPVEKGASTPAEMSDPPFQFDFDDLRLYDDGDSDEDLLPLLSHERFAYAPDNQAFADEAPQPEPNGIEHASEAVSPLDIDYDDPWLEHFPSDRDSIMATLRLLSSTVEADHTVVDIASLSPVFTLSSSDVNSTPRKYGSSDRDATNILHKRPLDVATSKLPNSIDEVDEAVNEDEMRDSSEDAASPIKCIPPSHKDNISLGIF